jgi:hypothetical protein
MNTGIGDEGSLDVDNIGSKVTLIGTLHFTRTGWERSAKIRLILVAIFLIMAYGLASWDRLVTWRL